LDDGTTGTLHLVGLICTFTLSAFFSVIKIIFSSAERSADGADDERLRYYTSKVSGILKNRAALSSIVVVGKTLSNTAFAVLAFYYHSSLLPNAAPAQQWWAPLAFSCVMLTLFAHYIPRAFAMRFYRSYLVPSIFMYGLLSWLLTPLSWLFTSIQSALLSIIKYDGKLAFLSDEDKARITADDDTEALNEEEREMIRSIFDLSETTVDEIMVPRINIIAADIKSDLHSVIALIKEEGHSRIPVYKDTIDQITGILYARDILPWIAEHKAEEWDLSSILRKCHYVPMGKKVNDLMKEFKVKHLHLAVIVDEYGGTAGMVTMEDILEEIVGDIQDEYDEDEMEIVKVDDNTYLVDPHVDLHDLSDELDINLAEEEADYNTLSGLIYHEYGDVPTEGTQFDHSGLHITVLKMDNQRIEKVKIEVLQSSEKSEAETF
jgi:CBS domain containing-hemolysin-like protein